MIKHLVTSGCSFSDNVGWHWPHYLADSLKAELYSRGCGSAGNSYISKSLIYQLKLLLDRGIDSKEILAVVMWTGIDRKDLFINSEDLNRIPFNDLINTQQPNPVSFIDTPVNTNPYTSTKDGYLLGCVRSSWENSNISNYKNKLIFEYFPDEALAMESYENFLRVQWFCESKGIKLLNLTYMSIMHYPQYIGWHRKNNRGYVPPLTRDVYKNVKHLYELVDFNKWYFWRETDGMYEYCLEHKTNFHLDGVHPSTGGHCYYVDNFLLPKINEYIRDN